MIDKSSSDVQDAVDNKTKIMKEVHKRNISQKVICLLSRNFLKTLPQVQQVQHGPGGDPLSVNY